MTDLSDVQVSLSLFAEAIAGRPIGIANVENPSNCWPWRDEPANAGVALPARLPDRAAYRIVLLQQLLRNTTAEDVRATGPVPMFDQLVDVVDDHRVTAEIRRSFPGAIADLDTVMTSARASAQIVPPLAAHAPDVRAGYVALLRQHALGVRHRGLPDMATAATEIFDRVQQSGATYQTSVEVARALLHLIDALDAGRDGHDVVLFDDETGDALASEATAGVSLDGGSVAEVVPGDHHGGGQLSTDLDDDAQATTDNDQPETTPPTLSVPVGTGEHSLSAQRRTFVYDEWDYHDGRHRPAWCRVVEERLRGDDHDVRTDVRRRYQHVRSEIRRQLFHLPAEQLVRVHRSLDGDELDLDATIEAVVDRRAGAPVDDRLQIRRDRAARDVATAFLVDLSASTSSPAVLPEPDVFDDVGDPLDDPSYGPLWDAPRPVEPVRRVIDVAKDAVVLMADALHELGDQYAVYGFSGTGRESVEFKIGKDFGDRTSPSSWASIAAMKPLRYTRMGPAVRHAAAKLGAVGAQTKMLIMISDGYPQDTDYGRDRTDRAYGMHDTARALADATKAGIETFCVTIDPAGHDYLREMCPDGRYLVIDEVEALPAELAKLYLQTMGA